MKKVLLIEDDSFIQNLVSTKLITHAIGVSVAESAEDALEMLEKTTPDIIVLDLELPQMQGLELLKKLRRNPEHSTIPVIVFSNNDEPEMKEKCKELGVEEFFVKVNTNLDDLARSIISK